MTAHKHAALMLQYAQDAMETDKPWERWEFNKPKDGATWYPFTTGVPTWFQEFEYRRKPRTMTHTVTIPEPLREAPKRGETYYVMDTTATNCFFVYWWSDDETDRRLLKRGLCFATKEDAIAAAKAMMPIKGEEA